jgi:competence protein ComEC
MSTRIFFFSLVVCAGILFFVSCSKGPTETGQKEEFSFDVFDVGQGLAQAAVFEGHAILFDIGPASGYDRWRNGYDRIGNPLIKAIVVSHRHEDHIGTAAWLESTLPFSGLVVISPNEDTAGLRDSFPQWRDSIRFITKKQGDTLGGLDGVLIECLWPPALPADSLPLTDDNRNRYSLVFRLAFGATSVLVTSDIDSFAEKALYQDMKWKLQSDIMMIPHHGSSGSLDQMFFGYVLPKAAIISFGLGNTYGHPADAVYDICSRIGSEVITTERMENSIAVLNHIMMQTNGEYWLWHYESAQ